MVYQNRKKKENSINFFEKSNFATSICCLKYDGEILKPEISLMKIITEAETCMLDAQKQTSMVFTHRSHALVSIYNI